MDEPILEEHREAFEQFAQSCLSAAPRGTGTENFFLWQQYKKWLEVTYPNLSQVKVQHVRELVFRVFNCTSSRKRSYVQFLHTTKKHKVWSLQKLIPYSLIKHGHWNELWESDEIWALPSNVRLELFDCGTTFAPQIKKDTLEAYEKKITETYIKNNVAQKKQKSEAGISTNSTSLIQPSYETLLEATRNFLQTLNSNASRLRQLPKRLGSKAAQTQTSTYWLPIIESCYGSVERFLFYFITSPQGKVAFRELLKSGSLSEDIEEAMHEFITAKIQAWQKQEQQWFDKKAVEGCFGTNMSQQSYQLLAQNLCLSHCGQATNNTKKRILPVPLRSPEIIKHFQQKMHQFGSGWNIPWVNSDWLVEMVQVDPDLLQPIVAFLDARSTNKGKWLRQIYDAQFISYQTEERINLLLSSHEELSLYGANQTKWEAWVLTFDLWNGVPDTAYVAYRWYKALFPSVPFMKHKIDGVSVSSLPCPAKLIKLSVNRMVGQFKHQGPYLNPMSGAQLADAFSNGYIPIGKVMETALRPSAPKIFKSRFVDLQTALTWLTVHAVKHDLLKLKQSKVILKFGIWGDGTCCLKQPLFTALLFLLWEPATSKDTEDRWVDALRLQPIFIGVLPETQETVREILSWIRNEANQLRPLHWQGYDFHYQFKLLTGDFGFLRKATENVAGAGECRCGFCTCSFNNPAQYWSYFEFLKCQDKSLPSLMNSNSLSKEQGILNRSSLLPEPDTTAPEWLSDFLIGIDALHTGKGHFKKIIERLQTCPKKRKRWNNDIFNARLTKEVKARHFSDLDGGHMRLLAMKWKKVIKPSLTNTCDNATKLQLYQFFHEWTEILWILYARPEIRTISSIRLRLHVLLFRHLQFCKQLFPNLRKPKACSTSEAWATGNFNKCTVSQLSEIIEQLCNTIHLNRSLLVQQYTNKTNWSALKKPDLFGLCQQLYIQHKQVTVKFVENEQKQDSIMSLYCHVLVAHTANFYEVMDFCNASAERGEGFLAFAKKVLKNLTCRNLQQNQTLREIFIRHGYKSHIRSWLSRSSTASQIKKAFQDHKFEELHLLRVDFQQNKKDLDAFLSHLMHLQYKQGIHWNISEQGIHFITINDTIKAFKASYPCHYQNKEEEEKYKGREAWPWSMNKGHEQGEGASWSINEEEEEYEQRA